MLPVYPGACSPTPGARPRAGRTGTGRMARGAYSYTGVGGSGRPARSASAAARASAGRYSSP